MLSGQTTVSRLHALIVENDLKEIQVYRFDDNKLHNQSQTWSFGHEFVEVGDQSYNLSRLVTYLIVDQSLCLYF